MNSKHKKRSTELLALFCYVSAVTAFQSCLKEADLPTLTTSEVNNIKMRSASAGGNVTDDGGAKIDLRGVCWGTADNPSITDSKTYYWKGTGSFICLISGLMPDTYYHVRAFAANSVGIAYGNEVHFTSLPLVEPMVTTTSVSFIRYTMARANGNIECNDETLIFDKGFCLSTSENPTDKDRMIQCKSGTGSYYCWLEGLQSGTVYHVRAYAVTLVGMIYGDDICFRTQYPPVVKTAVKEFTQTSAIIEGNITWPDDSLGKIWDWGICYGTEPDPRVNGLWIDAWTLSIYGNGIFTPLKDGVFTFTLRELTPGTTYHVITFVTLWDSFSYGPNPVYMYNDIITQYGNEVMFTTSPAGKVDYSILQQYPEYVLQQDLDL